MRLLMRLSILAIPPVIFFAVGCDKNTPTPVPPKASAAPQPAADDAKAINEFLNKDKSKPAPIAGLPANHPPIDGGTPPPSEAANAALPPGHPPIEAGGKGAPAPDVDAIHYVAPASWTGQPVTSTMRKSQYLLPRAEGDTEDGQMVVFYFGAGQGGAVEANIDRWKGMFTTSDGKPVSDSEVKRESHDLNGLKVTTLDVTGRYADPMAGRPANAGANTSTEFRMLSAIVETPSGPWFFKGVGPVATMKAHEENFKTFVNSIKAKP